MNVYDWCYVRHSGHTYLAQVEVSAGLGYRVQASSFGITVRMHIYPGAYVPEDVACARATSVCQEMLRPLRSFMPACNAKDPVHKNT